MMTWGRAPSILRLCCPLLLWWGSVVSMGLPYSGLGGRERNRGPFTSDWSGLRSGPHRCGNGGVNLDMNHTLITCPAPTRRTWTGQSAARSSSVIKQSDSGSDNLRWSIHFRRVPSPICTLCHLGWFSQLAKVKMRGCKWDIVDHMKIVNQFWEI